MADPRDIARRRQREQERATRPYNLNVRDHVEGLGAKFIGAGDAPGVAIVEAPDGTRGTFNANSFLEQKGVSPDQVNVDLNSPSSAIPESPVGIMDRVFLSLGNTAGRVDFLSDKFDDVRVDEENGIVVQENGVWKQVDPDMLGDDPWTITESIADTAEFAAEAALPIAGGVAGAAAGTTAGPAGTFAGGVAGATGGAAARSSLGRLVGTYKATPEEFVEDMALETLMAATGESIPVVGKAIGKTGVGRLARVRAKQFVKAVKKFGSDATDTVKELFITAQGRLTGAGSDGWRVLLNKTDEITDEMKKRGGKISDIDQIRNDLTDDMGVELEAFLSEAQEALPKQFEKSQRELFNAAGKSGVKIDIGEVGEAAKASLLATGVGKVAPKTGKLVPLTSDEMIERFGAGEGAEQVTAGTLRKIRELYSLFDALSTRGTVSGRSGAQMLTGLNRRLNQLSKDAFKSATPDPALERIISKSTEGFKTGMKNTFEKAGLADIYQEGVDNYAKFADPVAEARRLLRSKNGVEQAAARILAPGGKGRTFQNDIEKLGELAGTERLERIKVLEATKRFAPMFPKLGFATFGLGAAGSFVSGPVGAGTVLVAASPRVNLKAMQIGKPIYQTLAAQTDLLKATVGGAARRVTGSKGAAHVKAALTNENVWREFGRQLGEAEQLDLQLQQERQEQEQLMQQVRGF